MRLKSYDAEVMVGGGGQGVLTGSCRSSEINADFAIVKRNGMSERYGT